jgi:hypothetical protein
VIALLWCIPAPARGSGRGWAALAMFGAWMFYYRASRPLGFGMLAIFVLMGFFTRWLLETLGFGGLLLAPRSACSSWLDRAVRRPQDRRPQAELPHRPHLPADRAGVGAGEAVPQAGLVVLNTFAGAGNGAWRTGDPHRSPRARPPGLPDSPMPLAISP